MDQQAVKRRVRIAVSVFFAVVAVLLCVLWVRSYSTTYSLNNVSDGNFAIGVLSSQGEFRLFFGRTPGPMQNKQGWSFIASEGEGKAKTWPRFAWHTIPQATIAHVPQWFLIIVTATIAVLPWIKLRFSLRTLLIATTLLAVVLGLVCYAVR